MSSQILSQYIKRDRFIAKLLLNQGVILRLLMAGADRIIEQIDKKQVSE